MNELRTVAGNLEEVALATLELDELELVHGGRIICFPRLTCDFDSGVCTTRDPVLIDDGL